MQGVSIKKLEVENAAQPGIVGFDAQLFAGFPDGGLQGCFSGVNATTGTIDFAGTQAPLFPDEKNLPIPDHKKQNGALGGLPPGPIRVL
jgi:hypothetical protein